MSGTSESHEDLIRVLIVDDEPGLVETLSVAVTEAGWRPYAAADGESALRAARGCAPHAVILDGMLPGLDGVQVLRRLRYENPRLPVLMLTARDALEHRIDGLSAGADDYVTKPFSLEEVVLRLRGLLRRAGVEDAMPARRKAPATTTDTTCSPPRDRCRRPITPPRSSRGTVPAPVPRPSAYGAAPPDHPSHGDRDQTRPG